MFRIGRRPGADAAENRQVRLTALGSMERIGLITAGRPPEVKISAAKNEWVVSMRGFRGGKRPGDLGGDQRPRRSGRRGNSRGEYHALPGGIHAGRSRRAGRSCRRGCIRPWFPSSTRSPASRSSPGGDQGARSVDGARHDMYGVPFEVFRGQNQPIGSTCTCPRRGGGRLQGSAPRSHTQSGDRTAGPLTVWDFALPDRPTHRNHFGSFRTVGRYFNAEPGSDKFREIEMRYCRAMAEHRLNPPIPGYLLPEVNKDGSLTISPERHEALKQYLAELHVADFEIPRAPFARLSVAATGPDYKQVPPDQRAKAQRYYREYYDYLKRSGWEKDAYVYLWDEPNIPENYEQVLVMGQIVHEAVPELKCVVVEQTYPHDPSWADIDPAVDIWCPLWAFIDRGTIERKIAGGDEVWSYGAGPAGARYHPQYEQVGPRSALLAHRPPADRLPGAHVDQPAVWDHGAVVLVDGDGGDRSVEQPGVCPSRALQRRRLPVLPRHALRDRRAGREHPPEGPQGRDGGLRVLRDPAGALRRCGGQAVGGQDRAELVGLLPRPAGTPGCAAGACRGNPARRRGSQKMIRRASPREDHFFAAG